MSSDQSSFKSPGPIALSLNDVGCDTATLQFIMHSIIEILEESGVADDSLQSLRAVADDMEGVRSSIVSNIALKLEDQAYLEEFYAKLETIYVLVNEGSVKTKEVVQQLDPQQLERVSDLIEYLEKLRGALSARYRFYIVEGKPLPSW